MVVAVLTETFAPSRTLAPSRSQEAKMLKKLAILGLALTAYIVPTSTMTQARAHSYDARNYRYPKGFYYRNGAWHPYRGYGHPYRGGYYDRWGRWHRYA